MSTQEETRSRVAALADEILAWAAYHESFEPAVVMRDLAPGLDNMTSILVLSRVADKCSVSHSGARPIIWTLRSRVRRELLDDAAAVSNAHDTPIGRALRGEGPYGLDAVREAASADAALEEMLSLLHTLSQAGPRAPGYEAFTQLRHAADMVHAAARRDAVFAEVEPTAEDVERVDALMEAARDKDPEAGIEVLRYLDDMLGRGKDTPSPM